MGFGPTWDTSKVQETRTVYSGMTELLASTPRNRTSLFTQVRAELLAALEERRYGPGDRLPSEPQLAAAFGISRPTIREVLRSLEGDGYVRRIHGVGTFATERQPLIASHFDVDLGVTEAVEAAAHSLGVEIIDISDQPAGPLAASRLGIPLGSPTLGIERVIRADNAPVAHAIDVIPGHIADLTKAPYTGGSVYRYLEVECGLELAGGVADVTAVTADERLAGLLDVPVGLAVLRTDQVERNHDDEPILFSTEHYVPSRFTIRVRRVRRESSRDSTAHA